MSDLFGSTLGFTPVFKGRELAIAAGQGAGQSISRGQQVAQGGKSQALQQQKFDFQKQQYNDSMDRLKAFGFYLNDGMPE